jgi:uncharacterized membrane protein
VTFVRSRAEAATPANVFVVLASTIGLAYLLATPPLATPDEFRHLRRVTQIAHGGITDGAAIPASLERFAQVLRDRRSAERRSRDRSFSFATLRSAAAVPLDASLTRYAPCDRYLPYGPIAYAPAVGAIWLGSILELRPLGLLYLTRLSMLVGGISLLYVAFRICPTLPWTTCLVAMLPTVAFVRSGVSADTFTTAFAFLLFALVMRARASASFVTWRDVSCLVVVATALGLCKVGYLPLVLVVIALPSDRFASPKHRWQAVVAVIGVSTLVSWLWLSGLGDFVATDVHRRADVDQQRRLLLDDPLRLLTVLEATWLDPARLWHLATAFVGRVLVLSVPPVVALASLTAVVALLFIDRREPSPLPRERLIFLAAVVMCLAGISLGLYLKTTAPGSETVRGFQGRYLYPLVPFALFAILPPPAFSRQMTGAAALIVAVVALAASACGLASIVAVTWLGGS